MIADEVTEQRDRELINQLQNARYASLTSRAVTDAAKGIVDRLIEFVEGGEEYHKSRKNKRSAKARSALWRAMGGFVGDLLRAQRDEKSGGWVYRSLKANNFSGGNVSYRQFLLVVKNLSNFVETKVGYQQWSNGFDPGGPRLPIRGKATRFRATPLFIHFCSDFGVEVSEINDHFIQDLPEHPLVKNAGSLRDPYGAKVRGKRMPFDRTGKALLLEQQVRELNEFLDGFDLRGGSHRGYVRIFNQGDHPAFDWNKGGRMYSQGDDSYQRLSRDDRLRMTINGEAVCEIDIRASYLTIYHAHYGAPLDRERDPYALPGFPAEARGIIKSWFIATFGSNGHLDRWPHEIAAEYREKHGRPLGRRYPVKRIRKIAIEHFPLLEKWGTDEFGWADLMFIESQAMIGAMRELMEQGIPSLSVHDSLIVPVSKRKIAEDALSRHYLRETGADPVLTVHDPLPSKPAEPEEDFRDDDFEAESASSNDHHQSVGRHESLEDDDPYDVRHSRGGDEQEDAQGSAEGFNNEWGYKSEEDEVREEEYTSHNSSGDESKGEYDPSEPF